MLSLARRAADVGVERFVLDDGWFLARRSDDAGLGDWEVDPEVWPEGLTPLITGVHELGMDFGLWVEPEMVSLDSNLARAHPEWILQPGNRLGVPSRQQHVLDLGNAEAYAHVASQLHGLLATFPISFLKWDHNRMVVEAGHQPGGTPGVHRHTIAVYHLLDELRLAYPGVEIESCAGGGGRIDLGILERTDRVWASDCIDALERQQIQRCTGLLLPPELVGTHIGAPRAHTTGRTHALGFRAATALWGHLGIEWNLADCSDQDLSDLAEWVQLYKNLRALLHAGTVVISDHPDSAIWVNGVVATDQDTGLYGITTVSRSVTWPPGRVRLPGLSADQDYHIAPFAGELTPGAHSIAPEWWNTGVQLSGRVLAEVGIQIPLMFPEHTHLIYVRAVVLPLPRHNRPSRVPRLTSSAPIHDTVQDGARPH